MAVRFDTAWNDRPFAPAEGTVVCQLDDLTIKSARGFKFGEGKMAFELVVVGGEGELRGYINQCPHFKIAMNARPDDFLNKNGHIQCAWHYAQFQVEDGYCLSGPCEGMSLVRVPLKLQDGTVAIGSAAN
jgi:naringenin degradation protein FdeD